MARYFTLQQAERLLPEVERLLRDVLFHRDRAQEAHNEIENTSQHIRMSGGAQVNPGRILSARSDRDSGAKACKAAIARLEETGAQLKDLDSGLIDFPSLYQKKDVCLCWKLNEDGIHFWHGVEEGFSGRKPIDQAFLEGHSGDPLH